ncbi:hypothetical protein [Alkalihalobacillus trypoxylicola]|uniref:hypothetical protein n=1 Tax=Alkalihalobacillus trypoxylicola TaxID=519424 RepID=UPI000B1AEC58|nr:hypothetical protein [Alkalihalobacillus trypoxylicola]
MTLFMMLPILPSNRMLLYALISALEAVIFLLDRSICPISYHYAFYGQIGISYLTLFMMLPILPSNRMFLYALISALEAVIFLLDR